MANRFFSIGSIMPDKTWCPASEQLRREPVRRVALPRPRRAGPGRRCPADRSRVFAHLVCRVQTSITSPRTSDARAVVSASGSAKTSARSWITRRAGSRSSGTSVANGSAGRRRCCWPNTVTTFLCIARNVSLGRPAWRSRNRRSVNTELEAVVYVSSMTSPKADR